MDDIKISHVILKVVDGVISHLTTKYVNVSPLSISRVCVHDYLCMRLDCSTPRKLRITMPKNIKGILETAVENMNGIDDNPSANNMFTVQ